jgi:hypothetical protein
MFNEDWQRYKHGGITQEKLGKMYGFAQQSISLILPIYPKLAEFTNILVNFSNMDLVNLARVENDIFHHITLGLIPKIEGCPGRRCRVLDTFSSLNSPKHPGNGVSYWVGSTETFEVGNSKSRTSARHPKIEKGKRGNLDFASREEV